MTDFRVIRRDFVLHAGVLLASRMKWQKRLCLKRLEGSEQNNVKIISKTSVLLPGLKFTYAIPIGDVTQI